MSQIPMTPTAAFMAENVAYYTWLCQSSPEALPVDALCFQDIETLTARVSRSGNMFFTDEMMSRWGTVLFPALFGERFFVTRDHNIADRGGFSVRWTYRYTDGFGKIEVARFDRVFESDVEARHFAYEALAVLFPGG